MNRFFQSLGQTCALAACLLTTTMVQAATPSDTRPGMNAETFSGLEWRGIGPALMSGRIADIAVDPERRSTWYVAVGSGGVWKTENRGTTWTSVFDGQGSYSIGCVTIDPNDNHVIWVGTGENVSGRHVGYGDGIYKSLDGGATWNNMGLEASEHIGMIRVDPRDSDVVYVAAQGPLWSGGGDRGLYKTTDGGESWQRILGGGDYTGVNEVHLDPRDPDVIYAVRHQRFRNVAALINGGPESGIFKSADGGATWVQRDVPFSLGSGLDGVFFLDESHGWAWGNVNYRTVDGGTSWKFRFAGAQLGEYRLESRANQVDDAGLNAQRRVQSQPRYSHPPWAVFGAGR